MGSCARPGRPARKEEDKADDTTLLLAQLTRIMGKPQREFASISPYFVPGAAGTQALVTLAQSGVKIRLLTNSLAANDVIAVHAGYSKQEALCRLASEYSK